MSFPSQTLSSKRSRKRPWKPSFPYQVDYNDHFETPLQAYRDIQPLIDWMTTTAAATTTTTTNTATNNNNNEPVLYDPYYCDGQTKVLLHELGYEHVVHEKRDFYLDVQNDSVPAHTMLVTNPPYSEEHKKKCLDYALKRLKNDNTPFSLLLPAYVATKSYFRQLLQSHGLTNSMVYIVPQQDYAYNHPEGTGQDVSPFRSMWFCGLPQGKHPHVRKFWNTTRGTNQPPHLYLNFAELEVARVITAQHRPNPKQRKKMRRRMQQSNAAVVPEDSHVTASTESQAEKGEGTAAKHVSKKKKTSKYRDNSGQRKKRRF